MFSSKMQHIIKGNSAQLYHKLKDYSKKSINDQYQGRGGNYRPTLKGKILKFMEDNINVAVCSRKLDKVNVKKFLICLRSSSLLQ